MVESFISDNMGIRNVSNGDSILEQVWDGSPAETEAAMESLWALAQSNEYVYSKIFQSYDIFPGN